MEVTLDAAPTTPEMTLLRISGEDPSLHLYCASSSMLVIEPATQREIEGQSSEGQRQTVV